MTAEHGGHPTPKSPRPRPDAGRVNTGCAVIIAVVFVLFLVLLGVLSVGSLLGVWEAPPPSDQGTSAGRTSAPPATSPSGCEDETAGFRDFARPRAGTQGAVLYRVTLVCWEPAGTLRAETSYSADINITSVPMTWLCATISEFITASGRAWQGFTVVSTHQATPGWTVLASSTPGGACTRPPRN